MAKRLHMQPNIKFALAAIAVLLLGRSIHAEIDARGFQQPIDYDSPVFDSVSRWVLNNISQPDSPHELVPGKPASDWAFSLAPYGWLPALHSTITITEFPRLEVHAGPIDVLAKLDWAVFLKGEARKGRWGVLADGMYAEFSAGADPRGPLYTSASTSLRQSITSLALAFRVIDDRRGFVDLYAGGRYFYMGLDASASHNSAGIQRIASAGTDRIAERLADRAAEIVRQNARVAVDALAERLRSELSSRLLDRIMENPPSIRDLIKLKNRIEALNPDSAAMREFLRAVAEEKAASASGTLTKAIQQRTAAAKDKLADHIADKLETKLPRQASQDTWWIDPVIGLRAQLNFTHWLYLSLQGDVGGFGAGSEIAWFAQAALGANLTRNTSLELGYRYMYFDYQGSTLSMQAGMPGFYGGLVFRF